jgi:hypothetical protein
MHTKENSVDCYLCNTKLAGGAAVAVGFKSNGNFKALNELSSGRQCDCEELSDNAHDTALLYAVFENVRDKFIGSVTDQIKFGVNNMSCNYQNGEFIITVVCKPTTTAVRKCMSMMLKYLNPSTLYAKYAGNMKMLNGSGNKANFVFCVNKLIDSMKQSINVMVSGKVLINKPLADFKKMCVTATKQLKLKKLAAKGTAPASGHKPKYDSITIKAGDIEGVVMKRYVESSLGTTAVLLDKQLHIFDKSISQAKVDKLKDKAKLIRYIKEKAFNRLGDNVIPGLVWIAMTDNLLDTNQLSKCCNKKLTAAQLVAELLKSF